MLTLHRHAGAREFLVRAEPWLAKREVEHAMVLQSARLARADDSRYEQPTYWATVEQDGELVGCAYRTPPFKVGMTTLPSAAVALVVADLAKAYSGTVAGFSGPEPTVTDVAKAWTALRGGAWSEAAHTRQHVLSFSALPPPPASGTLRLAGKNELGLAQSWGAAASIDSGIAALDGRACAGLLGAKQLYFWVDDQPRCMIGILRQTSHSVAIGIVYTPAAFRGKGYAAAALGALDALLEERGIANRFLYLNPASESAQALARKLGCRLVQDAVDIDWT
jgi:predicted GNAT family acetyltransferase